jgi:pimeloyl-ACP methyl ester carboxylesterase
VGAASDCCLRRQAAQIDEGEEGFGADTRGEVLAAFADLLAQTHGVRVLSPTHPGFNATIRPDDLDQMGDLATLYVQLIEELDLTGVTVIGSSIGGWIAAEVALLHSPRITVSS